MSNCQKLIKETYKNGNFSYFVTELRKRKETEQINNKLIKQLKNKVDYFDFLERNNFNSDLVASQLE